jgi:exodeoxyribonuclease VII large subunit
VQGAEAVGDIVRAIRTAHQLRPLPDALVITRGGGSIEDLWCFNDEKLVRAIFKAKIPVVSAVGHEIDVTLADLVADVRALTPTEAAERVLPSAADVAALLSQMSARMASLVRARLDRAAERLESLAGRRVFRYPYDRTRQLACRVDDMHLRATRAARLRVELARRKSQALAARLEALSPLAVFGRGYSLTQIHPDGPILSSAHRVKIGAEIITQLKQGQLISRVEAKRSDSPSDSFSREP